MVQGLLLSWKNVPDTPGLHAAEKPRDTAKEETMLPDGGRIQEVDSTPSG